MPLYQGKSKKTFKKNVEAEMNSGKPQAQSLAISYAIQRKNKRKKMFNGGKVELSASDEKRPMPESEYADQDMDKRNDGNKPPKDDQWLDNPTVKQAQEPSPTKLSEPKTLGSDAFSQRNREIHDDEHDMIDRMPPESDKAQPNSRDNEDGPDRQGPKVPDMERQHNNKRAAYAEGGEVEEFEREDEANMQSRLSPGEHGEQPSKKYDEEDADRQGDDVPDMEREHSNGRMPYAEGGEVEDYDDDRAIEMREKRMNAMRNAEGRITKNDVMSSGHDQSGMINMDDQNMSIAERIMQKRKMMADGGEVSLEDNSKEDLNNEDQMSFDAGLKEQYDDGQLSPQPEDSNEHGREIESDTHDMIDKILRKIKSKYA